MEISFESYVILEKFTRVWWFYDPEQLTNIVGSWSLAVPYGGSTCEATWKCWKRKETRGELRVLGQNINIALVPWLIAIRKACIYMVGSILARSLCDIIRWQGTGKRLNLSQDSLEDFHGFLGKRRFRFSSCSTGDWRLIKCRLPGALIKTRQFQPDCNGQGRRR